MATLIGVVSQVVGEVFAVASDGSRRPVSEGDRLYAGEQLITGMSGAVAVALTNGQELTLGRDSGIALNAQLIASRDELQAPVVEVSPTAPSDDDLTDVERLQAAIEAGDDPTQQGEATAAGPGAGAGGAGGAGGGHSFVMLSEVGGALDPVIGFPTGPLAAAPLFPEGEVFAPADFSPELTVVFLDKEGSVVTGPGVVDEAALNGGENGGGQPGSNPGSDAETTSGTLIINSPDGIGRIEVLDASGNWVNVTGGGVVQGAYGVLVFDAAGNWTYTLTDNSLDHSNPNAIGADDQLFDNFSVRVFDLDGDVSPTVPLIIAINDDGPSAGLEFSREGGEVVLDESAGLQPGSHDVAGPLAVFNGLANPSSDMRAYAQGTAPAVVANYNFGADEGGATAVYSLALVGSGEGEQGPQVQAVGLTTTSGSPITLSVENGLVVGRDAGGNAAFAISIDPDTGIISVVQYQSLHHPDASDANDNIDLSGLIRAVLTVTDGDGDQAVASADIGQLIRFVDDAPTAAIERVEGVRVTHDESAGPQNGIATPTPGGDANDNDTNAGSVVGLFSSVSNTGTDLSSPGYATSKGAVVDISGSSTGEDNEGATTVLSLSIVGGDGSDSGLTTTDGQTIRLYLENGLIVGRVEGGETSPGAAAFAIAIGQDGSISVAQYISLHHPDTGSADDAVSLAGKVRAVVTVTDGDGDVDTAQVGIGGAIRFEDDGPTAVIQRVEGVRVTHDESAGLQNATETPTPQGDALDDDTGNPDVIALFAGVSNVGTDLEGYAASAGPVVSIAGTSTGEDNEGATTVLSLEITGGDGTDSGLTTTDGQVIRLYMENGLIVGRVDGDDQGPGAAVFAVAIGEDGTISVAQYMSLNHPDTGSRDEGVDLGGLVKAVVTVTDGDGDVDVARVNIGGAIRFEDDAPTANIQVVEGVRVTHDETPGLQNGTATPTPGSDANDNDTNTPSVIALFSSVTDAGTALTTGYASSNGPVVSTSGSSTGEDQEGATTVLSLAVQNADSGLSALDGSPIVLSVENGLVVGRVDGGIYNGQAAFAVAIGQDGSISIAQYLPLQHPDTNSHDEALNLSGKIRAVVTVTDGDDDVSVDSVGIGGVVRFEDDGPTASNVTATRVLDDEGLNGGINGGPGDVSGAHTSTSGNLGYDAGADGLKSIVLTGPSTLGSEDVTSTWDGATTLTISSSRGDLMTVVLTDLASGAYTVNLLKPLMHTVSGTEDNIILNVGYKVTDGDGDTANGSLTVTINDDTPTIQVGSLDLNSSVTFIGTDAGYSNSYGYYIKGEDGNPLSGKVIWANVHDQSSGDTFDLGNLDPASTGFFIIPNGGDNAGLLNGADVTFQLVGGKWQAFVGGTPLIGADGANVLFSDATLNPGGSHLQDTGNAGNQNWEDKTDTSDYDYNDVSTSVTWGATQQLQVDESNLGQNATADFSGLFNVQPGADGLKSLDYKLTVQNANSGLVDSISGQDVVLTVNDAGVVEGRTATGKDLVFTLSVGTDGKVTLDQIRAIVHPTSDPDEAKFLGSGHISLSAIVTDKDGDTATGNLDLGKVISFKDDAPSTGTNPTVKLDDDAQPNGIPGGTGDDDDSQHATGTLSHSYGSDGAGSISWVNTGAPAGFTYETSGNNLLIKQGSTTVLTVTLTNNQTGTYSVVQNAPIRHVDGDNENNQPFQLTYKVTDKDGDSVNGTLKIDVDDDTPLAKNDVANVNESVAPDINMVFVLDFSGSISKSELGQMLDAVKAAAQALFAGNTGDVQMQVVAFSGDAKSYAPVTSYAAFESLINSLDPNEPGGVRPYDGNTDFTAAIEKTMDAFNPLPGWNNQVVFISDGNPNEQTQGGNALLTQTAADWQAFINDNSINVTAIGVGNGIDNDNLQDVDLDGSGSPILIGGFSGLVDTLLSQVSTGSVTGNVLNGSDGVAGTADDDSFGADGKGGIKSLTVDGDLYTWNGSNATAQVSITTDLGGKLVFNFSTGAWSYTAPSGLTGNTAEHISYSIVDADGDPSNATLTINITATDDAPVALNDTFSTNEDTAVTITSAGLFGADGTGPLNDSDADSGAFTSIRVTQLASNGLLQLNGTAVTLDQVISLADIDAGKLLFVPDGNESGAPYATFKYQVSDGTTYSNVATVTINVAAVNDAPVAVDDTFSTTEDNAVTITSTGLFGSDGTGPNNDSDVDSSSFANIRITQLATNGVLKLNGVAVTLDQVISAADIAANKLTFVPDGNENGAPYATFQYQVSDGSLYSNTATVTINVTAVNDAPQLDLDGDDSSGVVGTGYQTTYTEGAPAVAIADIDALVTDIDNSTIASARIVLTNAQAGDVLTASGLPSGITGVVDTSVAGRITVTLTGVASKAAYESAIEAVRYSNTSNNPSTTPRNVTVVVNDGATNSNTAQTTINVVAVDNGPDAKNDVASVVEGHGQDFNVVFVLDFSGSINNTELNQMLSAVKQAGSALFDGTSGHVQLQIVAFSSTATSYAPVTSVEAFGSLINSLNPAAGGVRPFNGGTDFTDAIKATMAAYQPITGWSNQVVFISDGNPNEQTGSGGNSLANATAAAWDTFIDNNGINVTTVGIGDGINNARLQDVDLDGQGSPLNVAGFGQLVDALLGQVVGGDVSGNVLWGSDGVSGTADDDSFGVDGPGYIKSITIGSVTYTWNGASIITPSSGSPISGSVLTGIETTQHGKLTFNFATGAWGYVAPDGLTSDLTEQFGYTLVDADGTTDSATLTVNVIDANSPPAGADATLSLLEDASHVLSASSFGFSDAEGGSLAAVKITTLPSAGQLTLNGSAISAGSSVSVADINAGKLVFTPVANASGNGYATFTFQVQDDGGTANGGGDLDPNPNTITFNVTPVNDSPVLGGMGGTLNYTENAGIRIIDSSVTLSDIDSPNFNGGSLVVAFTANGTTADQLSVVNQGTASGQLNVSGSNLRLGTSTIGTIAGGSNGGSLTISFTSNLATLAVVQALIQQIAYANTSDNPSTLDRTLSFTVRDGDGTANGGVDTASAIAYVHVNAVNDAPLAKADHVVAYNASVVVPDWALLWNDSDADSSVLSVNSVGSASSGSISRSGNSTSFNDTGFWVGGSFNYTTRDEQGAISSTARVDVDRGNRGSIGNSSDSSDQIVIDNSDSGNTLAGGSGNDVLIGGVGDDILNGGNGNDLLVGGAGDDTLNGGGGIDTASYIDATSGVTVSLASSAPQNTGGAGTDTLSGIENLIGSNFGDMLTGNSGDNTLSALVGNDILIGGAGNDTFVWNANDRGGNYHDIVKDFGNGDDKLDLSQLLQGIEGPATADVLTQYLSFDFVSEPGSTVINVASAGSGTPVDQTITLENTVLSGGNAADIIQGMLDHNQLVA
ncbi:retention module-containing protein [Ectopseudomonas mendocina]|nr:retention module-containing protein [Pseudomonas mendocina]